MHAPTNEFPFPFKFINISFSEKEKLQERFFLESARLGYAKEYKIAKNSFLGLTQSK
jgi:hypothetical protein